jgi:iron complex outermembrane recepter protein
MPPSVGVSVQKIQLNRASVSGLALIAALAAAPMSAAAQSANTARAPQPAADQKAPANAGEGRDLTETLGLQLDTLIVTGTTVGERQFETSYAVTTLSSADIERISATGTIDMLNRIPGVYGEASGGEVQNVWRIRGVPGEGAFTEFQEDGAPILAQNGAHFANSDVLSRIDIMTQRFEVVRGGTAPVFADQAIAMMNNISRRGSDVAKGAVRLTAGTIGLGRVDAYWSGPLADKTYLALGGFYRVSDGYRKMGYTADKGGQFRMNLTREIEGGDVNLFVRVLNDKNAFILPVPLANPDNPQDSLSDVLDPFTGTLNTPSLRHVKMMIPQGSARSVEVLDRDLTDGRQTRLKTVGLDVQRDLGDGWRISNKARATEIDGGLDAIYSEGYPTNADVFAQRYASSAAKAFGAVARFGYAIAGANGAEIYDPAKSHGLILTADYRATNLKVKSLLDDFRVSKQVSTPLGRHDLTFGLFGSHFEHSLDYYRQRLLIEMATQPRPLDLVAYNSAGKVIGSVTDGGVITYGTAADRDFARMNHVAVYLNDQWHITDKLRIDAGFRQQYSKFRGRKYGTATYDLGDKTTLADDKVKGLNGQFSEREASYDLFSWTAGAYYEFSKRLAGYVRYAKSYNAPSARSVVRDSEIDMTAVDQYEGGLKLDTKKLDVFATVFYAKYAPYSAAGSGIDPKTGEIIQANYTGDAVSPGFELAAKYRPVRWFRIDSSINYNGIKLARLTDEYGGPPIDANGKMPTRQPKWYGSISPSVSFKLGKAEMDAYARVNYVGDRYVDVSNTTLMPAYTTLDLGVSADFDNWKIKLAGRNVTKTFAMTEGNPRADKLVGQGTPEPIYGRPIFGRTFELTVTYDF